MKVIEQIHVVTPVARVAAALQTLVAEHGYTSRIEPTIRGLRLVVGNGQLAVDLVQRDDAKTADRGRPISQLPFGLPHLARERRKSLERRV